MTFGIGDAVGAAGSKVRPGGVSEPPVPAVRGTRDWSPREYEGLDVLEAMLLQGFLQTGYERVRIPALERTELHERKSGAAIVSKLFEVRGDGDARLCLRPELTAGVVRAYGEMSPAPPLPWRVCVSGPVFRNEPSRPGKYREFHQIGVELLGASGPEIDAELVWLADWSLARLGLGDVRIRLGDLGVVHEILARSGLPPSLRGPLVEIVSEGSAEGRNIREMDRGLDQLARWLADPGGEAGPGTGSGSGSGGGSGRAAGGGEGSEPEGLDRLYRTFVPRVVGRRSGAEVLQRLRRKWEHGRRLPGVVERVRERVRRLADARGPAREVLERLGREFSDVAPDSTASLRDLLASLEDYGVDADRIELDMGLGRGLGFYSRTVFALSAETATGPVEVCGGGRYDGLARVLGSDRDERGVGFAMSLERLWHVLGSEVANSPWRKPMGFLVMPDGPRNVPQAVRAATYLRDRHQRAVLETNLDPSRAMERVTELGLSKALVVRGPWRDPAALVVMRPAGRDADGRLAASATVLSAEELHEHYEDWSGEAPR